MANAIKHISVQHGHDVTTYTLTTFGGAGGQHACQVADALGMTQVLIHPFAGVLSAYGMGLAEQTAMRTAFAEAYRQRFSFLMPENPLVVEQQRQRAELTALVEALRAGLEERRRGGKRQAAPFSLETRVTQSKPPGRKPGA